MSFENILEHSKSDLCWYLDRGSHDPVRGTTRADVGSGLLSRESNPRSAMATRMSATESEMRKEGEEGGAFEDGYDSCRMTESCGGNRGDSELRESSLTSGSRQHWR